MNVSSLYKKIKQLLNDSNTALISKGCNEVNSLNDIPSEIEKIEINRLPYLLRDEITEISEEDLAGCTSIRNFAFYNKDNLISITIPDSVVSIGEFAFNGCNNLTGITLPDTITSIGANAFYNTEYYNNPSNWENDVLYIDKYLIKVNNSLSGEFEIKDGTLTIANNVCDLGSALTSVTIPDSVVTIGYQSFYSCNSLANVVIGGNVTSIEQYAFNTNIQKIDAKSVESWLKIKFKILNEQPLFTCTNAMLYFDNQLATDIVIPNSITNIGDFAFFKCSTLTSVTIPDSVTTIGDRAFGDCNALTDVYLNSTTPPTLFGYTTFSNSTVTTIHIPVGSLNTYKSATNWSMFAKKMVEDIVIK